MKDAVGPVLRMCDEVELVIQAIVEDNLDRAVEVGHGDEGGTYRPQLFDMVSGHGALLRGSERSRSFCNQRKGLRSGYPAGVDQSPRAYT